MTHTSKLPFETLLQASGATPAAYRRHYRSRNQVPQQHAEASHALRPDTTSFDDSVILSLHKGTLAAKQNITPAIFTLIMMALLAWAYNAIPAVGAFFNQVSVLKQNMGISFAIVASGLCIGLLSESITILSGTTRRWTMQNTLSFAFLFITFGLMSAIIYSFPTDLQLAISIIAISLWVCILNMLTKSKTA
ncbi:MAG TPA: hypothetical protein DEA90_01005 [Opitutae bacterium]|nr:hypothetical protein [Opitutae bacterium]